MASDKRLKTKRTPDQLGAINAALENGSTIEEALVAGGYSPSTAKRGRAALAPAERDIVLNNLKEYAAIGAMLNPALVKNAVVGRLASNVINGTSAGNEAAKMLGSVREYDIFRPEQQIGLLSINLPNAPQPNPPTIEAVCVDAPKLLGE